VTAARREEYDVVVVGAGSGGCVVARRLVDAGLRVLLLEAGASDDNPAVHDPRRSHELWRATEDWDYETVPQAQADARRLRWPRGRVLGGSSSLNGMIYTHGAPADFDHWAYLGNDGWSFADVLPVFKRSEDFDRGETAFHGVGGPLHVMSEYEPHVVHQAIVAAAQEAGLAFNADYNGESQDGVSFMQYTIKDKRRFSAARAYLDAVLGHELLTLRSSALAHRLVVSGGRCEGVEYLHAGELWRAVAQVEVVLCAGVVESPKLLLLSGIGPAEHLRQLGIEPVVDLPGVGENLQDHVVCPVIFEAAREIPHGPGGLPEMQSHHFWRSRAGLPAPDVQPIHFTTPRYEPWMKGPKDGITLHAAIIRPASRGTVRLASTDPTVPPLVDPRYLSAEIDLDTLEASLELNRRIASQPALSEWVKGELFPGPDARTSADVRSYLRSALGTYHHQAGTCRMGVDELAVVDPRLRLHGLDGVRVADASVMPAVTSGNTHAPTVMIAERAATFIASDGGAAASGTTPETAVAA